MDINQDNLTEKIKLLRLLIQNVRFETGVRMKWMNKMSL